MLPLSYADTPLMATCRCAFITPRYADFQPPAAIDFRHCHTLILPLPLADIAARPLRYDTLLAAITLPRHYCIAAADATYTYIAPPILRYALIAALRRCCHYR